MKDVSTLMDGELEDGEAQSVIAQLKARDDLRAAWAHYHTIGDALRDEYPLSAGFSEQFRQRLAQEPTILAPQRRFTEKLKVYALSAAASVAAVAVVGWLTLFQNPLNSPSGLSPEELTVSRGIVPTAMNDYLWLHEENSPVAVRPTPLVRMLPVVAQEEATDKPDH